jgi:hypothetical protein
MNPLLRPYDLQAEREWPEDDQIEEWLKSLDGPSVNILVGPRKCGKTRFVETQGLQIRGSKFDKKSSVDPMLPINIIDHDLWRTSEIRSGIKEEDSFIFDSTYLTRLERQKILKLFPKAYYKVVIAWELSDEELILRGSTPEQIEEAKKNYERPSRDENFDELVYIFS